MKLTIYQKQAIVSQILADLPKHNEKEEVAKIKVMVVKAMSPACRKLYKANPKALRETVINLRDYGVTNSYYRFELTCGDANVEEVLKPLLEEGRQREKLRNEVTSAINGCSTRKQLVDRYPEFTKYLPPETEKATNLPTVYNIVEKLAAAGWKQTVYKGRKRLKP